MVADSSRYDVNTVTFYPLFNCMAYCVFVCVELLKKVTTVMHVVEVGSSRQTAGAANSPAVCL